MAKTATPAPATLTIARPAPVAVLIAKRVNAARKGYDALPRGPPLDEKVKVGLAGLSRLNSQTFKSGKVSLGTALAIIKSANGRKPKELPGEVLKSNLKDDCTMSAAIVEWAIVARALETLEALV